MKKQNNYNTKTLFPYIYITISNNYLLISDYYITFAFAKLTLQSALSRKNDNTMNKNQISHAGVIDSISEGNVRVRIVQNSACSGCKISAHCSSAESKEKLIDVFTTDSSRYTVGQEVNVIAAANVGFRAVIYGFVIPTAILLVTIILLLQCFACDEAIAALSGIAALVPYYFILYLLRDKMKKTLTFSIE